MVIELDETIYKSLRAEFDREYKRIEPYISERRPLTEDLTLRNDYKKKLVQAYNQLISFFKTNIQDLSLEDKLDTQSKAVGHLKKLKECFRVLRLQYTFDSHFLALIDINEIYESDNSDITNNPNASVSNTQSKISNQEKEQQHITANLNSVHPNNSYNSSNMTQSPADFIAMAHRMINYRYDGDPLALDSFIDAIELLKELCETGNASIMLNFL